MSEAKQFLINQLLAKRRILALMTLLLGGAVTWGIVNTSIDSTFSAILSEDDPDREEVEKVRKDFPPSTVVLFAFLSTGGDVFNFEMLHAMEDLTNRYIEVESAVSVGSLLNRRLNAVDADRFNRDYLIPELSTLTQDDLNSIRKIALSDEALTKISQYGPPQNRASPAANAKTINKLKVRASPGQAENSCTRR